MAQVKRRSEEAVHSIGRHGTESFRSNTGALCGSAPGRERTMGTYRNPEHASPPVPSSHDVEVRQWRFDGHSSDIATARHSLVETLADHDWDDDGIEVAQLLVSELVTNAVRHACTPFVVTAWVDGVASVAVTDGDPDGRPLLQQRQVSEGGMGLKFVASLSTSWGVHHNTDGKAVWFLLDPTGSGSSWDDTPQG
jgi:anti-sigma regulatory factor (Ser/Thr protein kinase)